MAAATRRLISSIGSFAYSALSPPCTNKVPSILTIAGLRAAHRPSSPEGLHASLVLDPAERMLSHPFGADLLGRIAGLRLVGGFELPRLMRIYSLAASGGVAVGEGGIFAGRRVAVVAEQVHRLVIAEDDDDPAA